MDANIQKALNDKFYDKRKSGALEYDLPQPVRAWQVLNMIDSKA